MFLRVLSSYGDFVYRDALIRSNPLEKIVNMTYAYRSAVMANIDSVINLTEGSFNVVDLWGTPCGYLHYLLSCGDVKRVNFH